MRNRILLSAVNAKYIHSNLAVRYLKKYCETQVDGIAIAEFSINDNINSILKRLYLADAETYGFSCYIWNIGLVLDICSSLKKARPDAVIILGGPEVSYDPAHLLSDNSSVDYIVVGEGEQTLLELLDYITSGSGWPSHVQGIAYREGGEIMTTQPRQLIASLDKIPFPYDGFEALENKIIYYETSRGCPFNCQYCLSSTLQGVRYLSMDRIQSDINKFAEAGIRQVKLVDRTFNCNIERSIEIMQYIMQLKSVTNFHLEIAADLINERFLETIDKAPVGMFQFEIGVQSTNPETLSAIQRKMDFKKVSANVRRLLAFNNTHLHLDLIAGLPYEDIKSFKKSFNDVYNLHPHMLQLGFLKLLKGSGIRAKGKEFGIEHHDFPPYEVISTNWLSYSELLILKDIEQVLEHYGNSGRFRHTLSFLLDFSEILPFEFYRRLAEYWSIKDHFNSSKGISEQYNIMKHFAQETLCDKLASEQYTLLNEYLKLDWLLYSRSGSMPVSIERFDHSQVKEQLQEYLRDTLTDSDDFEAYRSMSMRELLKHVGYEVFTRNIFGTADNESLMVMFYPLKQVHYPEKPYLAVVPLAGIAPVQ
ncbi:MAG TPA: B12-binding domain-containing radical SAM protein [Candidatus Nitrosocosmicus sp.]|nr:B12-binding domain-containing radical SAM protein [Candidatus Nitrosocosmicus sp.]